jgi:hypothetical protein
LEGLSQQSILYIPIIVFQYATNTAPVFTSPNVKTDLLRPVISIDHQSIVMYLSLKGLNVVGIHNDLVVTLKGEAKSYSTVIYDLRKPSSCCSQVGERPTDMKLDESAAKWPGECQSFESLGRASGAIGRDQLGQVAPAAVSWRRPDAMLMIKRGCEDRGGEQAATNVEWNNKFRRR